MLKILCVCGCGFGLSFVIEMMVKVVLKKLEIFVYIEYIIVFEVGVFKLDMILM